MTSDIKITFLGTSDSVPTAERNHTSILLNHEKENILIDCGEGTQRQFRKAGLNPCKITKILITHWHGDHVLGISGLLQTLSFSGYNRKLLIYGPKGTKNFMKKLLDTFVFRSEHPIEVKEVSGKFLEDKDFFIESKAMAHGTPCNAYSFVKKGQIKIDKKKLEKLKIPSSSLLKKLKEGKDIIYAGKKYKAKDLTFREGDKKISFILDTSLNDSIVPFAKNSDLLVCEATFDSGMTKKAKEYHHLTSSQAAKIAKEANVKKLVLTHLSQRYAKNQDKILKEARRIFKNSFLARDLESFKI